MTRTRTIASPSRRSSAVAVVAVVALNSDHQDAKVVWAIFGPALGWNFIGTGLYAWHRRPESRIGALMVLFGFAWFVSALSLTNSALLYSIAQITGGLWGGVFLQLEMTFPSGRLARGADRAIVIAGYLIFTVASIPALLVARPARPGLRRLPGQRAARPPRSHAGDDRARAQALLYVALFVIVLVRLTLRWRRTARWNGCSSRRSTRAGCSPSCS